MTTTLLMAAMMLSAASAFVPSTAIPRSLHATPASAWGLSAASAPPSTQMNLFPIDHDISSTLLLSDTAAIIDTVRSVAVVITAVLFALAGLTLLMANIIIPAAAKELEKECMELAPELWAEYQAKLNPGETIDQRPELMQELGAKIQPLLDEKIRQMELNQENTGATSPLPPPPKQNNDDDDDDWNGTTVDLSAITDQIPVPGDKKEEKSSSSSSSDSSKA